MAKERYAVVGRYMNGKEVTGYHLKSESGAKDGRFTREQTCLLIGRGQVVNCDAQIYQDKVIFRGVGINLDELPVKQEGVATSTKDSNTKKRAEITGVIKTDGYVTGYGLKMPDGTYRTIKPGELVQMIYKEEVNATIHGNKISGIGVNLDKLPIVDWNTQRQKAQAQKYVDGKKLKEAKTPDIRTGNTEKDSIILKNEAIASKFMSKRTPNDIVDAYNNFSLGLVALETGVSNRAGYGSCYPICGILIPSQYGNFEFMSVRDILEDYRQLSKALGKKTVALDEFLMIETRGLKNMSNLYVNVKPENSMSEKGVTITIGDKKGTQESGFKTMFIKSLSEALRFDAENLDKEKEWELAESGRYEIVLSTEL